VKKLLERPRLWKAYYPFQVFAANFAAIAILKTLILLQFFMAIPSVVGYEIDTSADISQVHALADWANDHDM
jgi:hypothetical protein